MSNTVKLHRVLAAPPERVYKAFTNPDAMIKWYPPHGFIGKIHEIDVRVGGGYRMSFENLTTGNSHSFTSKFIELQPNEYMKLTDQFDDPNLPGEMLVTITFKKVSCGTELTITQENVPEMIPLEMCYLGWQQSLAMLTQLVEPEIRDDV